MKISQETYDFMEALFARTLHEVKKGNVTSMIYSVTYENSSDEPDQGRGVIFGSGENLSLALGHIIDEMMKGGKDD